MKLRVTIALAFFAVLILSVFQTPVLADSTHTVQASATTGIKYSQAGTPDASHVFGCQKPASAIHCYGPDQIRNAYQIQSLLNKGITGKGRTIVIVDSYQSPTIVDDLKLFNSIFGLPSATLNIIAPDGLTPFDYSDPNMVGWSGEISLDVEWAHAVAPDATIDLVLAKSNQDADILSATTYAVEHNLGDVISQSFGEDERCVDPTLLKQQHELFRKATAKKITLIASAGDQGAAQPTCDGSSYSLAASSPAAEPLVTAVGGTQLFADLTTGAYGHEVTWNETATFGDAGGGGFSVIYKAPGYQRNVKGIGKMRGLPDVSYNAAIDYGVLTAWGVPNGVGYFYIFGGTSSGSPQWAGITALADQMAGKRLGFLNKAIYEIGQEKELYSRAFHDITTGDNSFTFTDANNNTVTIKGYNATQGWDPATGWGTPKVDQLLPLLLKLHSDDDDQGMDD
ncbi:MAG TPA: S53 family peptidase [Chloroflexia bacterium]|nr:S53 family peptidase [Chloroflexia bacterium]